MSCLLIVSFLSVFQKPFRALIACKIVIPVLSICLSIFEVIRFSVILSKQTLNNYREGIIWTMKSSRTMNGDVSVNQEIWKSKKRNPQHWHKTRKTGRMLLHGLSIRLCSERVRWLFICVTLKKRPEALKTRMHSASEMVMGFWASWHVWGLLIRHERLHSPSSLKAMRGRKPEVTGSSVSILVEPESTFNSIWNYISNYE